MVGSFLVRSWTVTPPYRRRVACHRWRWAVGSATGRASMSSGRVRRAASKAWLIRPAISQACGPGRAVGRGAGTMSAMQDQGRRPGAAQQTTKPWEWLSPRRPWASWKRVTEANGEPCRVAASFFSRPSMASGGWPLRVTKGRWNMRAPLARRPVRKRGHWASGMMLAVCLIEAQRRCQAASWSIWSRNMVRVWGVGAGCWTCSAMAARAGQAVSGSAWKDPMRMASRAGAGRAWQPENRVRWGP